MDTDYPLSAKRLYALIGEKISEFPSYFIERLEKKLEASEQSRTRSAEKDGMDEVAKACGVGPATLRRQLNGAFPLYVVTLFQVTQALGLQLRVEAGPPLPI